LKRLSSESETAGIPHPLFLNIAALRIVAGYAHWIPITRGLYKDCFNLNFPGWEWNQIIPVLIQRKVLVMHPTDPGYRQLSQGLYISSDIEGITIWPKDGETEVAVTRNISQESIEG
jgi:hypothetical protein